MSQSQTVERGIDSQPTATVNTTSDGDPLGVALFLGADDLEALGIDDADHIHYAVENGALELEATEA